MTPAQAGAWNRGFVAGISGEAVTSCPAYRAAWARRAWLAGVEAARSLLDRQERLAV